MKPPIRDVFSDEYQLPGPGWSTRVHNDLNVIVESIRFVRPVIEGSDLTAVRCERRVFAQRRPCRYRSIWRPNFDVKNIATRIPDFELIWRDVAFLGLPDQDALFRGM